MWGAGELLVLKFQQVHEPQELLPGKPKGARRKEQVILPGISSDALNPLIFGQLPGTPVIWPALLRQFLGATRRASPVAQHVLATVLSLSPRRSEMPLQPACGTSCCLRPMIGGSASGAIHFRGHLCVHSRYGPVTRSPSLRWLCRWASGTRFPSYLPSKLQGL